MTDAPALGESPARGLGFWNWENKKKATWMVDTDERQPHHGEADEEVGSRRMTAFDQIKTTVADISELFVTCRNRISKCWGFGYGMF